MITFNDVPNYDASEFWFLRNRNNWDVFDRSTLTHVSSFNEASVPEEYFADFQNFRLRPEYLVGSLLALDNPEADYADTYDKLLVGSYMIRAFRSAVNKSLTSLNIDTLYDKATKMLNWLHSTDFYIAPASTQYHESFQGGLVYHTLKVYNSILGLSHAPKFSDVDVESAAMCALVHDWCKIGFYEPYQKNVKDEATGTWHKETAYKQNQTGIPLGHGVASMFLASKFFSLTPGEAAAIRWHMAAWRVVDSEMNELQKANETYPLVHLLQFADQLAIVIY